MRIYIAIQNDKPIPVGASSDIQKVAIGAQDWANYSHHRVSILKIDGPFVDLELYINPEK